MIGLGAGVFFIFFVEKALFFHEEKAALSRTKHCFPAGRAMGVKKSGGIQNKTISKRIFRKTANFAGNLY